MTIIITTHYIEEARRANTVGFMRKGHLLVQDSPDTILKSFGIASLELAFLHICSRNMDDLERERKRSVLSMNQSPSRMDVAAGTGSDTLRSRGSINHANRLTDSLVVSVDASSLLNLNAGHYEAPSEQTNNSHIKSPPDPSPQPMNNTVKNPYLLSQQHKYKQSFRTQANIVRTLVMKGVIKMKRSIPYVCLFFAG